MKLKIYKFAERYIFSIDDFSSVSHFFLAPDISPTYTHAWRAYSAARNLGLKKSYHLQALKMKKKAIEDMMSPVVLDMSAEEMLFNHYINIFDILEDRSASVKNDKKLRQNIYEEIKGVIDGIIKIKNSAKKLNEDEEEAKKTKNQVNELDQIISKFKGLVNKYFSDLLAEDVAKRKKEEADAKAAVSSAQESAPQVPIIPSMDNFQSQPNVAMQSNVLTKTSKNDINNVQDAILQEYAERACLAIEHIHPDVTYRLGEKSIDLVENDTILKITLNSNMNINKIISTGSLAEIFPVNSIEFYQRYWKPIVESTGHFSIDETGIIIDASQHVLPDIPNTCPSFFKIAGWNNTSKKKYSCSLWFKGKVPLWGFSSLAEKVEERPPVELEQIFFNGKRVECIDENLKTIFGKIGTVIGVILPNSANILELDVDFGRAIVRLTKNQIKILPDEI
jgi:hypothetical protein